MTRALLLLLLIPSLAWADGAELASEAAQVHEEHCTTVRGGRTISARGKALIAVAQVWTAVDEAHRAAPEAYLLYWRAVLASCLGDEEAALSDLSAFLDLAGDDPDYASSADDARRRLRREIGLRRDTASRADPSPPLFVGAAVTGLATAGLLGAAGLVDAEEAKVRAQLSGTVHTRAAVQDLVGRRAELEETADSVLVAGAVAGATTGALLVVAAIAAGAHQRAVVVAPTPGGFMVAGRW